MLVFILLLTSLAITTTEAVPSDAILLKDIQVLTLHKNRLTAGKRSSPVDQLACLGGAAASQFAHTVETVQCYNRGFDGNSYQWECVSELDKSLKLGTVTVTCEGYHYPDDPLVLKNSCGLEYFLEFSPVAATTVKKVVLPAPAPTPIVKKKTTTTTTTTTTATTTKDAETESTFLLLFIFYALLCMALYVLISPCFAAPTKREEEEEALSRKSFEQKELYTPSDLTVHEEPKSRVRKHIVMNEQPVPIVQQHHTSYINTTHNYVAPRQENVVETTTTTTTIEVDNEPEKHISTSYGGTRGRQERSSDPIITKIEMVEPEKHISTSYGGTKGRKERSSESGSTTTTTDTDSFFSFAFSPSSSSSSSGSKHTSKSYGGTKGR